MVLVLPVPTPVPVIVVPLAIPVIPAIEETFVIIVDPVVIFPVGVAFDLAPETVILL